MLAWTVLALSQATLVDRNVEENGRLHRFVFEIRSPHPVRLLVQVEAPTRPERDGNRVDGLSVRAAAAVVGREGRQDRCGIADRGTGALILMFDPQPAPLVVVVELRVDVRPGADAGLYRGSLCLRVEEEK